MANKKRKQVEDDEPKGLKDVVLNLDLQRKPSNTKSGPKFPIYAEQLIHVEPISGGGFCAITMKLEKKKKGGYKGEILLLHPDMKNPSYSLQGTPRVIQEKYCAKGEPESDCILRLGLKQGGKAKRKKIDIPNGIQFRAGDRMDVCIDRKFPVTLATPWICRITFT